MQKESKYFYTNFIKKAKLIFLNLCKNKLISFTFLTYCFVVIFIGDFIPIEFASKTLKSNHYTIVCISFPVCILWAIILIYKPSEPLVLLLAGFVISTPILLVFALFGSMCSTSTELMFKNKTNMTTIVRKSYGCGAWDSDFNKYTIYKITPFTPVFNIITKFDTTNIDKTFWIEMIDK